MIDARTSKGNSLKGKYVIACDGISSKKEVYLQDRSINKKKCYWT